VRLRRLERGEIQAPGWFPNTGAPAESFELDAGEGFFYRNRSLSTLPWDEDKPYSLP